MGVAATCAAATGESIGLAAKVEKFALPNGLRFVVVERRHVPQVSFHLLVGSGWADDPPGQAGLSRLVARMYGKGTPDLGSRNAALEQKALAEVEAAYGRLEQPGPESLQPLGERERRRVALKVAMDRAAGLNLRNWFQAVLLFNGASDLNIGVDADTSHVAYSLPSGRAEVFFVLTSEWLRNAAFRDFYQERDALEDALSTELQTSAEARLLRALLEKSFVSHPYRLLVPSEKELTALRTAAGQAFFRAHYVPANMVIAAVGDMAAPDVRRLAERYFGTIPAAAKPVTVAKEESPPKEALRAGVPYQDQPLLQMGWRRPSHGDDDEAAFELLASVFANEPGGWLRDKLVDERKMARRIAVRPSYPGGRYPCLFAVMVEPAPGRSLTQVEASLRQALGQLSAAPLPAAIIDSAKARLLANFYSLLELNAPLAARLAEATLQGGAARFFELLGRIENLTPEEVHRVSRHYLTAENSVTVWLSTTGVAEEGTKR